MEDLRRHAADERADLLALLEQLTPSSGMPPPSAWTGESAMSSRTSSATTNCPGATWSAGSSAARLSGGPNAVGLAAHADLTPSDLLDLARRCVQPRGLPAGFNCGIALTDGMIHHQDIRRPLGMPRHIPADRLRAALEFAQYAPVIRGFWHRRGLRLIATDVDWSTGSGPEVRGPGEAILLAIAGRDATVEELDGPGLATLQPRLHKASSR